VTGAATGAPTSADVVARVVGAAAGAAVWVGSGLSPGDAAPARLADGAIVGTALHRHAALDAPLDEERVRAMRDALDRL
jgi:predicted TIM-barrel enzyme